MHGKADRQGSQKRRERITQRRRETRRNRIGAGASESVIEFVRANGARRAAMRGFLAGVAVVTVGFFGAGACTLRANERPAAKGPNEDGTKPALVKIAGEGMMGSHAFQFLTELSDDVGARVTGSPAERKAEEWGVAKMKAIGLENVHTEKYAIWKGWTRGSAEAELLTRCGTNCTWTRWAGRVRHRRA